MIGDPALWRFMAIQLVRLGGIGLVLFGVTIMAGRLSGPPLAGFAFSAAGLICATLFPLLLARRWKSKDE